MTPNNILPDKRSRATPSDGRPAAANANRICATTETAKSRGGAQNRHPRTPTLECCDWLRTPGCVVPRGAEPPRARRGDDRSAAHRALGLATPRSALGYKSCRPDQERFSAFDEADDVNPIHSPPALSLQKPTDENNCAPCRERAATHGQRCLSRPVGTSRHSSLVQSSKPQASEVNGHLLIGPGWSR